MLSRVRPWWGMALGSAKALVPVGAEGPCPLLQGIMELLWIPTEFALDQQIHLEAAVTWVDGGLVVVGWLGQLG